MVVVMVVVEVGVEVGVVGVVRGRGLGLWRCIITSGFNMHMLFPTRYLPLV